jgi:hypothetical protein
MTKKSTWLPGQATVYGDDEPSLKPNRDPAWNYRNWAATPLGDFIFSGLIIVGIIVMFAWALSQPGAGKNLGLALFLVGIAAIALVAAILRTVRSIKRIIWRRENTALTGGVYLRAWQRTPKQHADRIIK